MSLLHAPGWQSTCDFVPCNWHLGVCVELRRASKANCSQSSADILLHRLSWVHWIRQDDSHNIQSPIITNGNGPLGSTSYPGSLLGAPPVAGERGEERQIKTLGTRLLWALLVFWTYCLERSVRRNKMKFLILEAVFQFYLERSVRRNKMKILILEAVFQF